MLEHTQAWVHVKTPRYCFLVDANGKTYFLHITAIKAGAHLLDVGKLVTFNVMPPLPGQKHDLAVNAIVGEAL